MTPAPLVRCHDHSLSGCAAVANIHGTCRRWRQPPQLPAIPPQRNSAADHGPATRCSSTSNGNAGSLDGDSITQAASSRPASTGTGSAAQPPPAMATTFQPRLLTIGLQRADDIQTLQHLWHRYQQHFNSFHFSALMQQLTRLHEQVSAGLDQAAATQQRQQLQDQQRSQREASLAELQAELGHLLNDTQQPHADMAAPGSRGNSRRASNSSSSSSPRPGGRLSQQQQQANPLRALSNLCPAIDGLEYITDVLPAPQQQQQQQQRPPQGQLQTSAGHQPVAQGLAAAVSTPAGAAPGRTHQQLQRPQWRAPSGRNTQPRVQQHQRHRQQHAPPQQTLTWRQQQQPQQQPQQAPVPLDVQLQCIRSLALTAARTALQPSVAAGLDGRCLVMVMYNLAKMHLADRALVLLLLQALPGPELDRLDAQQLSNLIWAVGVCLQGGGGSSTAGGLVLPPYLSTHKMWDGDAAQGGLGSSSSSSSSSMDGTGDKRPGLQRNRLFGASSQQAAAAGAAPEATSNGAVGEDRSTLQTNNNSSSSIPGSEDALLLCWQSAAAERLLAVSPECSSQGVAMACWGFAQLGFKPSPEWWDHLFGQLEQQLGSFSAQDLALLMCALGKMEAQVPPMWCSVLCVAACDVLPAMSSQQLTMCVWGLAAISTEPAPKAFVLLWSLSSMGLMKAATTQELSMWLYSLAVLQITPSPTWLAAYVETSFSPLTAHDTRPQDLVNVMWAISKLGWSPPLLYWRGLLQAALERFDRCGPQDLANCVSAAASVDAECASDAWLAAFLKASQPKLGAFLPVQLAHTINALAIISAAQQDRTLGLVKKAWQSAFVAAASQQLSAGRFSCRNLAIVVLGLDVVGIRGDAAVKRFLQQAQAVLDRDVDGRPLP